MDPTQTPPFMPTARIDDANTVVELTGVANQYWVDQQNDAGDRIVMYPDDVTVNVGDTWATATPLPAATEGEAP